MSRVVLLPWLLAAALACHRHHAPSVEADPGSGEVAIRVESHNFADIVVYLDLNGSRSRLGLAGGEKTTVFFIPWRRVSGNGTLRLAGDPVGDNAALRTESLSVRPGSLVVWTIESSFQQSHAAVY